MFNASQAGNCNLAHALEGASAKIQDNRRTAIVYERDLFGDSGLPGLHYTPDFLSDAEEREFIGRINASELTPFRFQQWTGKRLTASFGWHYDFDSRRLEAAHAMPAWLAELRGRAAEFARLEPGAIVHALVTRYDPGAGIGWHRDKPAFEHVLGISLGAAVKLRFRQRRDGGFRRHSLLLEPRSIYHLQGPARHEWEHGIAPVAEPRWSITFRSLTKAGDINSVA
jgi:alkylated DNA repair dioxygenase AlkB